MLKIPVPVNIIFLGSLAKPSNTYKISKTFHYPTPKALYLKRQEIDNWTGKLYDVKEISNGRKQFLYYANIDFALKLASYYFEHAYLLLRSKSKILPFLNEKIVRETLFKHEVLYAVSLNRSTTLKKLKKEGVYAFLIYTISAIEYLKSGQNIFKNAPINEELNIEKYLTLLNFDDNLKEVKKLLIKYKI